MKSRIYKAFGALAIVLVLAGCKSGASSTSSTGDMATLQAYMTGSFTSAAQAAKDSSYYDISLHMVPIDLAVAGNWLYVEQAVTAMPERPYRQRLYRLEAVGENEFLSHVYELTEPKAAIGKWKSPEFFKGMGEDAFREKPGCAVRLSWKNGAFKGATGENTCHSQMRGASYATSKVTVEPKKIVSWDQGWNEDGEQVWGAEKGGYIFLKQ